MLVIRMFPLKISNKKYLYARRTRAESLEIARNRKSKAQFKAFKGFPSALIKQQKQYQVKAKCSTTAVAEGRAEPAAEAPAAAAVHQARHQRTHTHRHMHRMLRHVHINSLILARVIYVCTIY